MVKEKIKTYMLARLHAVPVIKSDALQHVVSQGIDNYLSFNGSKFSEKLTQYVESMRTGEFSFKYAKSSQSPCLYASIYACMIFGMTGRLEQYDADGKLGWKTFFDSFQSADDGLFYPPELSGEEFNGKGNWGDGWGKMHLAGHMIIAYAHLGKRPKYSFSFLEPYYDKDYRESWLNSFKLEDHAWSDSNYIMNIVTLLQYQRDWWNDEKAAEAVNDILNQLKARQNPSTGLWNQKPIETIDEIEEAIRAAYHLFPLFEYDSMNAFETPQIIDYLLRAQNSWGGFAREGVIAGACEDIDAVDPLIRAGKRFNYRKDEVEVAVKKSFIWVLSNFNQDGGATFYIENEHHYGDHVLTSSKRNESNMFAAWFRALSIGYICDYLSIDSGLKIGRFPGYEISI